MFHVICKDGTTYKMNDLCNKIDYSDPNYLRCYHITNDCWGHEKERQIIAMFTHSSVVRIENTEID